MPPFLDHFLWFLFIDFTCVLALSYWVFGQISASRAPDLVTGYKAITKGILLFGNIPWVLMGIGSLAGWVEHDIEFFVPDGFQPIVMLFHLVILLLSGALILWVLFFGGDQMLVSHPNSVRGIRPIFSPAERLRLVSTGCAAFALLILAWITFAWLNAFDLIR